MMCVPIAGSDDWPSRAHRTHQMYIRDRRGAYQRCVVGELSTRGKWPLIAVTSAEKFVSEFADAGGVIDYTEVPT